MWRNMSGYASVLSDCESFHIHSIGYIKYSEGTCKVVASFAVDSRGFRSAPYRCSGKRKIGPVTGFTSRLRGYPGRSDLASVVDMSGRARACQEIRPDGVIQYPEIPQILIRVSGGIPVTG